jgi:hypothetical protein
MKLYERFADKNYHTSIATTFGIDFDAYESIVLPRLRGAGCRNNIVITDSRMLTHALGGASVLPRQAGRLYTVDGISASGVFHPKLFLQLGRSGGRLIIGSANLTASGLAGNLELVGMITCGEEDSGQQRLIAKAWNYVSGLIDSNQQGFVGQRDWMLARTPWLKRATAATGPEPLSDHTAAALLTTGEPSGIGSRFATLIDEPVSRLIVISPYWDMKLGALSYLIDRLNPQETAILLDPDTVVFPKNALSEHPDVQLFRRGDFRKGRFIHAKAIIAQTSNADHVLLGSANCTIAALGTEDFAGDNEEVCLYRRLPANSVLEVLELTDALTTEQIIDATMLEEPELDDELPFDELAAQMPGQFECKIDVLTWSPAKTVNPEACTIELLDHHGQPISCLLSPLSGDAEKRRFQIGDTDERPSFARLLYADGNRSAPAIITLIDRLRAVIHETHSRKTENALRELDSETEASLMLLEVLDVLEKMEPGDGIPKDPISIQKTGKDEGNENDPVSYQTLSYEQFIAGRRPHSQKSQLTHNSLAGSEVSLVRGFLNRILGMTGESHEEDDDNEAALKGAFDLGDETDNAEAAIASGQEFDKKVDTSGADDEAKAALQRKAAKRKATKDQIVSAATTFGKRIKDRKESGALDNYDILRLRALLMIICAASWSESKKSNPHNLARSSLQVLPSEGDVDSWPFVMGRLLFVIFGGCDPAIRQLYLSSEHDQIPSDIIECWATCYWCLQLCLAAPVSAKEHSRIAQHLRPIAELVYHLTLPTKAELLGDDVITLMDGMSARYADKLGINPETISDGHRALVIKLFKEGV